MIVDCRGGQWGRGHDAGRSGHPGQVNLGEWCRTQERSGRAGLDHECVDTHGIDGSLGLDPKAVRKSGQDERHREDQSGADDRDDEAPHSPLHVAQSREQHARRRYRRPPISGQGLVSFFVPGERLDQEEGHDKDVVMRTSEVRV